MLLAMEVLVLPEAFTWPADARRGMRELSRDWHGQTLSPAPRLGLIEDPTHLWLVAGREHPFRAHPGAGCGDFQPELWRHDVAELFIASPRGGHYLEFNLAPTGAWWMAAFGGPRRPLPAPELPAVIACGTPAGAEAWHAALAIPLDWLRHEVAWGAESRLNATLILGQDPQRFLSQADLGGGEPDFHRPEHYPQVRRTGAEMA